jgi:hypothetical protein
MKLLRPLSASLLLTIHAFGAEPSWQSLRGKLQTTLGADWTVVSDFNSFTAIRRNVKVLNTVSRIDPILTNRDQWDNALTTDYVINIVVRPKLSEKEYADMARLRDEWIAARSKGVEPGSKDAYEVRKQGEAAVSLPDFFFGESAVYVTTTAPIPFKLRPDEVSADRDRLLAILRADCHPYRSEPEQAAP